MQNEKTITNYYSNKKIRAKIDKLLHKNSLIHSELGTDSTQEEKDEALKRTQTIAYEIYEICPAFAISNFLEVSFKEVL